MEIFQSVQFYIGLSVLATVFVLNAMAPMISTKGMRVLAVGIAVIVFLSYRGFI